MAKVMPKKKGVLSPAQRLTNLVQQSIETISERRAVSPADIFSLHPINPIRIIVAYSGGRDSTALVEVLARLYHRKHQTNIASVTVVHVHHGLSRHADEWVEHAQAQCRAWRLPLMVEKVYVNRNASIGIEAAAREARYRALMKVAKREHADVIMTAHHLDDRLETFLIQWMRGAGPDGLSAMSPVRPIESATQGASLVLARPWLEVPRKEIEAFAKRARLTWVEDDSNTDTRFLRNLIRSDVLPVLDQARAGWRAAAGRSISLVAQSAEVMRSVGGEDVQSCISTEVPHAIVIARLLMLPVERQALCLRSWLASEGIRAPSRSKLTEALKQIRDTHGDSKLTVRVDGREIRRWGSNLVIRDVPPPVRDDLRNKILQWNGENELSLGVWGGVLRFERCAPGEPGFDAQKLRDGKLEVRMRHGAEKIKLYPLRPSRNLKHHYQAAKIPAFERPNLPLIWLNGNLVFAAGLGPDVRYFADVDLVPERIRLVWLPDKPLFGF